MAMIVPSSPFHLMQYIRETSFSKLTVLLFTSPEIEASQDLLEALTELAQDLPSVCFVNVDLSVFHDAPEYFEIARIPTTIIFQATQTIFRVEGSDIPSIISKVEDLSSNWESLFEETKRQMYERLESIINRKPVMFFIKGSPSEPKCKFTRKMMGILQGKQIDYFDILEDNGVREWLKIYSNWPTFPQVYVRGELIGGVDIIEELHNSGELEQTLAV